ncbi:ribosome-associated translation inhibitor RaiA [Patescibacteria group bacterium]|nr:ribosome-associated translation inhibitor RaiA [Patescibacteria group bacterium]MBU4023313.1 ribosome-associated translation inhibitor RaiA [Patescibacteria group bacterium]MBU4078394.1 ribosome-associated translation inhibitor RaiA [Patescibacteria group bacterium]
MIIQIKATNIELNESLRIFVEDKVGELKKNLVKFDELHEKGREKVNVHIEIGKTTKHHRKGDIFRAEIQVYLPKKLLRAVVKGIDLRSAIIEARDELDREIIKYKGKRLVRARTWARRAKLARRSMSFLKKK